MGRVVRIRTPSCGFTLTQDFSPVSSSVNSNGSTIRNHSPESCDSVISPNASGGQIPFASRTTFTISFMISVSS